MISGGLFTRDFMLKVLLGGLIIGVIAAFVFATRASRPIRKMIELITESLSGNQHRSQSFGMIHQSISDLIQNSEEMKGKMEQQMIFWKVSFFERWLKGEWSSQEEIISYAQYVKIEISAHYYLVFLIDLGEEREKNYKKGFEELQKKKIMIRNIIDQMGNHIFCHEVEDSILACIYVEREDKEKSIFIKNLKRCLDRLLIEIHQHINIQPVFLVGSEYPDSQEVYRSYSEARQVLNCKRNGMEGHTLWYDEIFKDQNEYFFLLHLEIKLVSYIREGNLEELDKLLNHLFEVQFHSQTLPMEIRKILVYDLCACMLKLLEQKLVGDPEMVTEIHGMLKKNGHLTTEEDLQSLSIWLKTAFYQICKHTFELRSQRKIRSVEEIKKLIHSSYRNPDFSLTMVANQIKLSDVYISQLFKEETGINFFQYLENERMNEAKRLLEKTQLSVLEIALQTGYTSSNSFSRAFRRNHSQSPTSYRLEKM